jgi:hypothetical protein
MIKTLLNNTVNWIKEDFASSPSRCVLEITAWAMSVGANVMFMLTVPNVPFFWYLGLTVISSAVFAWALWTRNSLGGFANYAFLVTVDTIALVRMILNG